MQWQKFVAEFFLTLVDSKNVVRKGTILRYGMFLEEYSAENKFRTVVDPCSRLYLSYLVPSKLLVLW